MENILCRSKLMSSNNYSFPHPVLGRNDDIDGLFDTDLNYLIDRKKITLSCIFNLRNKTIEELITTGNASCYLYLTCSLTRYGKTYKLEKNAVELDIPAEKLRGRVEICFYILANKKISGYTPDGENKDYGNYGFEIGEGDILAHDFKTYVFLAEKTWEKLISVSSFMKISKSDKPDGLAEYDLNGEKIIIYLSEKDYLNYIPLRLDETLSSVFHASIAYPALIHVLNSINNKGLDYSGKQWYIHLMSRINNDDELKTIPYEETRNIPKICQIIFDNPIGRELPDLKKFIKKFTENE